MQWNEEQIKLLAPRKREDGSVINVYKTLARHPKLFDRFIKFNNVLYERSLPDRDREMVRFLSDTPASERNLTNSRHSNHQGVADNPI